MRAAINELVKTIIKKDSLSECSVSELQRLTTQYPYFGPVQFLLAQKLKEERSPLYRKQSQKAILYFHDQLWFDYMSTVNGNAEATHATIANPSIEPEAIIPEETIDELPKQPEGETSEVESNQTSPTIAEPEQQEPIAPSISEQPVEEVFQEELKTEAVEEVVEPAQQPTEEPTAFIVEEQQASVEPAQPEIESEGEDDESYDEPADTSQEPLREIPGLKIEPLAADAKLSFEPYHTVDYFASQGIKFKEEEKPKDKFSLQLRSFTEWLKTMKKLPESEIAAPAPAAEDKKVTQMAEHSLVDGDVLTESMADVWEMQGNHEKAIEVYQKLSLLNPSKSAYFAAKIEHLKQR